MARHPRTQTVAEAKLEITRAVLEIVDQRGLTFTESVQAINEALAGLAREALREERHPADPDKGADEA